MPHPRSQFAAFLRFCRAYRAHRNKASLRAWYGRKVMTAANANKEYYGLHFGDTHMIPHVKLAIAGLRPWRHTAASYLRTCGASMSCGHVGYVPNTLPGANYPNGPSEDGARFCFACGACWDHCRCEGCGCGCGRREAPGYLCRCCQRSTSCCNCARCSNCRATLTDADGNEIGCDCGACVSCCCCGAIKPPFFTSTLRFHTADKPTQRKENPSKRCVSAEIEVASVSSRSKLTDKLKHWGCSVVHDGSLPSTGFEINTAPAAGDLFLKQIRELTDELATANADVTQSCGCHMHVDARDFRIYDIQRLVALYCYLEPVLFGMLPKHRRTNNFCNPVSGIYAGVARAKPRTRRGLRMELQYSMYRDLGNVDSRKKRKYDGDRYRALNLHSWNFRGSVEFRMLNGSVDYQEISQWGMMLAALVDFAYKTPSSTLNTLIATVSNREVLFKHVLADPRYAATVDGLTRRLSAYSPIVAASNAHLPISAADVGIQTSMESLRVIGTRNETYTKPSEYGNRKTRKQKREEARILRERDRTLRACSEYHAENILGGIAGYGYAQQTREGDVICGCYVCALTQWTRQLADQQAVAPATRVADVAPAVAPPAITATEVTLPQLTVPGLGEVSLVRDVGSNMSPWHRFRITNVSRVDTSLPGDTTVSPAAPRRSSGNGGNQ